MLPKKGADIYQFIHKAERCGLLDEDAGRPAAARRDSRQLEFVDNYEGGWQELFPNPGDAYEYQGTLMPFHGEVAFLPWEYDDPA